MLRVGAIASLQAAVPEGGASLTLGTWGVIGLLVLLAAAATGWVLYALARRPAPPVPPAVQPPPPPTAPPAAPPPEPPPEADPLDSAFMAAEKGLVGAVLLCRKGRVERIGDDVAALAGLPREMILGVPLTTLVAAGDVLPVSEAIRSLEARSPSAAEVQVRLSGGPGRPGREVSARLLRPTGAPRGSFLVVLTDLSAAAAVAREAAEMASRVEEALRVLREGILVTAIEAGQEMIVLSNPGFAELFGIPSAWLPGRTLEELRERLSSSIPLEALEEIFPSDDEERTDIISAGGDPPRLIERTCRRTRGARREQGRIFTLRDVTRERAREEELRTAARDAHGARETLEIWHEQLQLANEGLERRMADLARLNKELKTLGDWKTNLLANVSHELQTPLVSIRGYTEMILRGRLGPLTEEQDRGLRVSLRNIDRLIGLIESLLTFARSEKDAGPLRIESFRLRPLVEEVLELLKDRAAERKVTVSVQFPAGDLVIRGDRDRIAQVFINLVTNAIKFNQESGSVVIEAARGSRGMARIEIRDTGVGIPREDLDRIFDRFFRGAADREGTGLGLAITKDILRLHGCMIRADSEPGKGSTFSFTLPLESRVRGDKGSKGSPPAEG